MERLNKRSCAYNLDSAQPGVLFLNQASGWLRSAEWIVRGAKTGLSAGAFGVLPAMHALWQGVELFLKGATEAISAQYNNETHCLDVLKKAYDAAIVARPELAIRADVNWLIAWDANCRPTKKKKRLPHGSDLRFILNKDNVPSWPEIDIEFDQLLDLSRDYRRDFCRIRRLISGVKGLNAFWEEGTFASAYPDRPFWFFCVHGATHTMGSPGPWEHLLTDNSGRAWIAYEGEAVNERTFCEVPVETLPFHVRVECSRNELPTRLAREAV